MLGAYRSPGITDYLVAVVQAIGLAVRGIKAQRRQTVRNITPTHKKNPSAGFLLTGLGGEPANGSRRIDPCGHAPSMAFQGVQRFHVISLGLDKATGISGCRPGPAHNLAAFVDGKSPAGYPAQKP